MLLEESTNSALGLGSLEVKVGVGFTTVADLIQKGSGVDAALDGERESEGTDERLEVIFFFKVLKRYTSYKRIHVVMSYPVGRFSYLT